MQILHVVSVALDTGAFGDVKPKELFVTGFVAVVAIKESLFEECNICKDFDKFGEIKPKSL